MTFRNTEELKQYILAHSENAVQKATEQVYQVIDRFVKEFYAEFTPELYERTYQLYRSLVKTDVERTANGFHAYVYFDFSSLDYVTGSRPTGEQVMNAAKWGGHGADGLRVIPASIGVWDNPMEILKDNKQGIAILKKMLISEGIPIK